METGRNYCDPFTINARVHSGQMLNYKFRRLGLPNILNILESVYLLKELWLHIIVFICVTMFMQGRGQNTLDMGKWQKSATFLKWEWNIIGDLWHAIPSWMIVKEKTRMKKVNKQLESDEWGRLVTFKHKTFVTSCIVEVVEVYLHLRKVCDGCNMKRKVLDSETYILLLMGYMCLTYQSTKMVMWLLAIEI